MRRDRGSIVVLTTAGLVAFLGAITLAVDVGYLYVVRNQLQNAADAAALAGAQGLLQEPGNYSATGPAVRLAIEYAARNQAAGQPVQLSPSEITFPKPNVIRIEIVRPVNTFFGPIFGIRQANIRVRAAAVVAPAIGGTGGWRPLAPPDQFGHGGVCVTPTDEDHGPFNPSPHTWQGISVQSDYYKSPYDPAFARTDVSLYTDCSPGAPTGFIAPRDVNGKRIALKVSQTFSPGNFFPVALGGTGADQYRANLANGWGGTVQLGDVLLTETGNMTGPTLQGITELIAKDPTARMVKENGVWKVVSDLYPVNESPRIVPIVHFDPTDPPGNGRTTFRVSNITAFFIEGTSGNMILGRFIAMRLPGAIAGEAPERPSSRTSGAGGYLLGAVQLTDPGGY